MKWGGTRGDRLIRLLSQRFSAFDAVGSDRRLNCVAIPALYDEMGAAVLAVVIEEGELSAFGTTDRQGEAATAAPSPADLDRRTAFGTSGLQGVHLPARGAYLRIWGDELAAVLARFLIARHGRSLLKDSWIRFRNMLFRGIEPNITFL
ncbi:hypothetical protein A3K70_00880 [Candidatus Bathyarchaeota archaeon RBG_16_48_13]|nr:MAG: hypothetical protein A3K70_00880 [Candidatus Bathyarchaeota archaeon RBG_16_48_13]